VLACATSRALAQPVITSIEESEMADTEKNKAVVRKYVDEVWNKQNLAAADELLADSFKIIGTGYQPDKEGEKEFVRKHRKAFPDMHYQIKELVAEGDKVSANIVGKGTHKGEWLGKAPTGNKVTVRGNARFTIKDGKITESVHHVDLLGVRLDIGAVDEAEVFRGELRRPR
jgi:predicted ester cyclase